MNDSMHINTEKDCSTVICISYEYDYFVLCVLEDSFSTHSFLITTTLENVIRGFSFVLTKI